MTDGQTQILDLLRGVRAVVFDLDDTLISEQAYALSGFSAVAAWLRGRLDGPVDPLQRMCAIYLSGGRRHVFDQVLEELGHPRPADLVPAMIRCYREHVPTIDLEAEARQILDAWRGRYRLGLISDGPLVMQQRKVAALDLGQWMDEIVLTDQWGPSYWKPNPRAFEYIEDRFALRGSDLLYVADNAAKDFVAPRRLGWRTAWLRRPGGLYRDVPPVPGGEPDTQLQSLCELDQNRQAP